MLISYAVFCLNDTATTEIYTLSHTLFPYTTLFRSGKIFRIAHMGLLDELDVISLLGAIELVLVEQGQNVKLGVGPAAASRVFAERAS